MNKTRDDKDPDETGQEGQLYHYNKEMFYAFDKEKGFSRRITYQNPETQIVIKQGWDEVADRLSMTRILVTSGKRSPIAWYMEKHLMEIPMLAEYMEISSWRVRWHLTPFGFKRMKRSLRERYASVFGITAETLEHPDFTNTITETHDKTGL